MDDNTADIIALMQDAAAVQQARDEIARLVEELEYADNYIKSLRCKSCGSSFLYSNHRLEWKPK